MLSNTFIIEPPALTRDFCDQLARASKRQLETSRDYKAPRLASIMESENLYQGVAEKTAPKNPFNESFPFMSGSVDYALARIDDGPRVRFKARRTAAWKAAQKFQAAWDATISSPLPDAKWRLKDRHGKKLGIMSGRAIHKTFAENIQGRFRNVFSTVDYKLFHCQPDGGGHLENHLYTGEEGIFITDKQLMRGAQLGYYDQENVTELLKGAGQSDHQEARDEMNEIHSRHNALGLDPASHSFVGQSVYHFVEWYLTFEGVRWYVLFDKHTGTWIRVKPLRDLFSIPKNYTDALYPYTSWAMFEEFGLFWSKGSADDWRPAAKYLNRVLNQELYNREKMNKGVRAYDPDDVLDIGALADWRPDGLIPVKRKGNQPISNSFYKFDVGGLTGSLDLATYVENFFGRQTGNTPGSKGASENDKKVGIFFGELQQIDEFVGTRNKSYTEMYEELALRFLIGLKDNLTDEGMEVELVGEAGFETETLTKADLEYIDMISITVSGGTEDEARSVVERNEKRTVLGGLTTVNPRWRDEQMLRTGPFSDEDIREAFNYQPNLSKALMAEAAQACELIREGRPAKLNQGANTAFIDYIINVANSNEELEDSIREKMLDYAIAHQDIIAQNEARAAVALKTQQTMMAATAAAQGGGKDAPAPEAVEQVDPLGGMAERIKKSARAK